MNAALEFVQDPLVQPIAIALVLGAIAYIVSRLSPLLCKLIALIAGVLVLTAGIVLAQAPGASGQWTWIRLAPNVSFTLDLVVTPLGRVVMIGSAAFVLLIAIYSLRDMAGTHWEGKFYAFVTWTLGGACLVALAGNLLVLLVGWELVTLMLFLLINQGRGDARAGAAKTYGILGFADACLLLAIALLVATQGGTDSLVMTAGPRSVAGMGAIGYVIYALILTAALAKAGAIPLHTWIPAAAEDAPTPVMALLPAALDKLLGIYLLATLTLRMFKPDWTLQVVLMVIGAVTILAAVLMAMMQHNLKKLLSFHAVSQVGYMVLGIGTGTAIGVIGGLFHMLNNAIYKSNLFLMSGVVGRASGTDDVEEMGGLAKALPITFVCGLISACAISGVPPFNGFVSKWLIYQGALQVSSVSQGLAVALVVVAVFGSALTLASFVKVIYSAFLSPAPKTGRAVTTRPRENFFLVAPMILLAIACVVLGLLPTVAIADIFQPGVVDVAAKGESIVLTGGAVGTGRLGLWDPTRATGLIIIGLLIGMVLVWLVTIGKRVRVVRPFLAGEVPHAADDRFRTPGTHFYRTIAELPCIGPLLSHGERGAMDVYHWAARHGNVFVQLLRSAHTGLISLYVAWCLVGLTAILVYLLVA